jgi:hypothetical protein
MLQDIYDSLGRNSIRIGQIIKKGTEGPAPARQPRAALAVRLFHDCLELRYNYIFYYYVLYPTET